MCWKWEFKFEITKHKLNKIFDCCLVFIYLIWQRPRCWFLIICIWDPSKRFWICPECWTQNLLSIICHCFACLLYLRQYRNILISASSLSVACLNNYCDGDRSCNTYITFITMILHFSVKEDIETNTDFLISHLSFQISQ